jgi:hypothetical protein
VRAALVLGLLRSVREGEEEKEEREKKKKRKEKKRKKEKMENFPNLKISREKNKRRFMKLVKQNLKKRNIYA